MTPRKDQLTPQKAMKWFDEIRKISLKRGGDTATKYEIQYMFKYADKLMQCQVPMPPVNVDEDGHYFECARCGQAFRTEYTVKDFVFCQLCGQRFREMEE